MAESIIEVQIPTDQDGYVLLKCSLCGEFFKLRPDEYISEDVVSIWCPTCGLVADSYLTEDVIEIATTKAMNYAMDLIHDDMKKMERATRNKRVTFKAGRKPRHDKEDSIMNSIDSLTEHFYTCCKKEAKIAPLYRSIGSFCPFCGVRHE